MGRKRYDKWRKSVDVGCNKYYDCFTCPFPDCIGEKRIQETRTMEDIEDSAISRECYRLYKYGMDVSAIAMRVGIPIEKVRYRIAKGKKEVEQ